MDAPGDPPGRLSPEIERELERALQTVASGQGVTDELRRAIRAAALDARTRGLHPEDLLIAFKAIEERIQSTRQGKRDDTVLHRSLIRALIEAYYTSE